MADNVRNSLIKRIHVLKRELSLDDDTYRTILRTVSGEESCADIDDEYLNLVKQTLEGHQQKTQQTRIAKNEHLQKKISKLGFILNWNWTRIADFCKQQTGKRSTQSCNPSELTKIVNGMIAIINDKISKQEIVLPHAEMQEFLKYTQRPSIKKEE